MIALRKDIAAKKVTMKDFNEALEKVTSSIREKDIKAYQEIEEGYLRTARGAAISESFNYTG